MSTHIDNQILDQIYVDQLKKWHQENDIMAGKNPIPSCPKCGKIWNPGIIG